MIKTLLPIVFTTFAFGISAQIGLWEVENVSVGDEQMTPVAKWFDINADGTLMSGNGGIINTRGTYKYDAATSMLVFTDETGVVDPLGAFEVEISDGKMTWKRDEDIMHVKVSLTRVSKIPFGPWDKCVGLWIPDDKVFAEGLFISWDRTFRINGPKGTKRGVWHIDAHNPDLTLYNRDGTSNTWAISFEGDDTMVWTSNFGDEQVFKRNTKGHF